MKYIMTKKDTIFIFHKIYTHRDMARLIGEEIVSAGFTDCKTCFGESISLGLKSRKEDTEILQRNLDF